MGYEHEERAKKQQQGWCRTSLSAYWSVKADSAGARMGYTGHSGPAPLVTCTPWWNLARERSTVQPPHPHPRCRRPAKRPFHGGFSKTSPRTPKPDNPEGSSLPEQSGSSPLRNSSPWLWGVCDVSLQLFPNRHIKLQRFSGPELVYSPCRLNVNPLYLPAPHRPLTR